MRNWLTKFVHDFQTFGMDILIGLNFDAGEVMIQEESLFPTRQSYCIYKYKEIQVAVVDIYEVK